LLTDAIANEKILENGKKMNSEGSAAIGKI
jgi:hypothetical protein